MTSDVKGLRARRSVPVHWFPVGYPTLTFTGYDEGPTLEFYFGGRVVTEKKSIGDPYPYPHPHHLVEVSDGVPSPRVRVDLYL